MMTLRTGKLHGVRLYLTGEGNEERGYGGGRIIEPDPAAVSRFREVMASKAKNGAGRGDSPRREPGIKRTASGVDIDLARKAEEAAARRAAKESAQVTETAEKVERKGGRKSALSDDEVMEAHRLYCLGATAADASDRISSSALIYQFFKRGLPVRKGRGHGWDPVEAERAAALHGLNIEQMGKIAGRPEVKAQDKAETAAAVAIYPAHPAPPVAVEASDLVGQLNALQALLTMAAAQRVRISGTMVVNLRAEVEF